MQNNKIGSWRESRGCGAGVDDENKSGGAPWWRFIDERAPEPLESQECPHADLEMTCPGEHHESFAF